MKIIKKKKNIKTLLKNKSLYSKEKGKGKLLQKNLDELNSINIDSFLEDILSKVKDQN